MDSQQPLLAAFKNPDKLASIRRKLQSSTGGIYQGTIPDPEWGRKHLGETYDKVILASAGVEKAFTNPDEYTVLGGWCALRTKDLQNIKVGKLADFQSEQLRPYTTVKEVAQWITGAVSLDQIVEVAGIYGGTHYALISEELLWTQKACFALEIFFKRPLRPGEVDEIHNAIYLAEQKRYTLTKAYIEYIYGRECTLIKIRDKEIFTELSSLRDEILNHVDLSLEVLAQSVLQNRPSVSPIQRQNIKKYVDVYTRILTLYTGHYLSFLQQQGYVKTPKGLIIEPWTHARSSDEATLLFRQTLYTSNSGANNFLTKGGLNEKIAFIGITEASDHNFNPVKNRYPIYSVFNQHNYKAMLTTLANQQMSTDLSTNVFMSGVNYLPYGTCRQLLLNVIELAKPTNSNAPPNAYETQLQPLAAKILDELERMMTHVFETN